MAWRPAPKRGIRVLNNRSHEDYLLLPLPSKHLLFAPLLLAVELIVGFCLPAEVVIDHGLQDIVVIGAVW
jgi:hypothetical protein